MSRPEGIPEDDAAFAQAEYLRKLVPGFRLDWSGLRNRFEESVVRIEKQTTYEMRAAHLDEMAREFEDAVSRAIMAERESFRPLLTELFSEVVWNAYNTGIVRQDGKWIDAGMSDAEQLRADLGFADVPQDAEALRLALPGLIERKVDAAIRKAAP